MKLTTNILSTAMAVLLSTATAMAIPSLWLHSGTAYDNGPPDYTEGAFPSDFDYPGQEASQFTLETDTSVTDVHWFGVYYGSEVSEVAPQETPPESDDFTIRFFNVDELYLGAGTWGDIAKTTPFYEHNVGDVDRSDTGDTVPELEGSGVLDVYEYSTFINTVDLTGDTSYFLSIVNNTIEESETSPEFHWAWQPSSENNGPANYRSIDGDAWNYDEAISHSFSLTSTDLIPTGTPPIPEPATAVLGLLGIAAVGLHLRRRR